MGEAEFTVYLFVPVLSIVALVVLVKARPTSPDMAWAKRQKFRWYAWGNSSIAGDDPSGATGS